MILITRPKKQSRDLEILLNSKGHKTFLESLYKIKYLKSKIIFNKHNHYIFPSINSVQSLILNKQIYKFQDANIIAIGKKVKQALIDAGCKNILITSVDSNALSKKLVNAKFKNYNFIYLCSNIVNDDFFKYIDKYNISMQKKIIYKTLPSLKLTKNLVKYLELKKINGAIFFSKLSLEIFLSLIEKYSHKHLIKDIHFYCISKRVASMAKFKKFKNIHIALKPNQRLLVEAIKKSHYL